MSSIRRFELTLIAAAVGWCLGWVAGSIPMGYVLPSNYPFLSERVPLPHRVPQYAGGVSFRFAMAHDVIHERFATHGPAYYRERDRLAREKLQNLAADDPKALALADDVGVGLERLGRTDGPSRRCATSWPASRRRDSRAATCTRRTRTSGRS
jgi:hypothetical protein